MHSEYLLIPLVHNLCLLYYAVSSNGDITHSQVIAFLKKRPATLIEYQLIKTEYNASLILSQDHLIYTRTFCDGEFNPV